MCKSIFDKATHWLSFLFSFLFFSFLFFSFLFFSFLFFSFLFFSLFYFADALDGALSSYMRLLLENRGQGLYIKHYLQENSNIKFT